MKTATAFLFIILSLSVIAQPRTEVAAGENSGATPVPAESSEVPLGRGLVSLPTSWDWLAGTYWYVPQQDLPAYLYDQQLQTAATVPDQTVFHITESKGGYFRGSAEVQIGNSRSPFVMLGSVTPDGSVSLTFVPSDANAAATSGTGHFAVYNRQLAMLNQMASSPNDHIKVLHWAYMLRTQEGDASWDHLPGVNVSVPVFLGGQ